MTIYKVSFFGEPGDGEMSRGYGYFPSRRKAKDAIRAHYVNADRGEDGKAYCRECEIHTFEVRPTKKSILRALNVHGSHPDNG